MKYIFKMKNMFILLLFLGLISSCTDEDCPMVYAPVCSPDGIQYDNDCIARNAGVKEYTGCGLSE